MRGIYEQSEYTYVLVKIFELFSGKNPTIRRVQEMKNV